MKYQIQITAADGTIVKGRCEEINPEWKVVYLTDPDPNCQIYWDTIDWRKADDLEGEATPEKILALMYEEYCDIIANKDELLFMMNENDAHYNKYAPLCQQAIDEVNKCLKRHYPKDAPNKEEIINDIIEKKHKVQNLRARLGEKPFPRFGHILPKMRIIADGHRIMSIIGKHLEIEHKEPVHLDFLETYLWPHDWQIEDALFVK